MEYNRKKLQNLVGKIKFSGPELLLRNKLKLQCGDNNRIIFKDFHQLRLCARKIGPWKKNNKNSKQKCFATEGRSQERFMRNGPPGKYRREHCFDDYYFILTKSCVWICFNNH